MGVADFGDLSAGHQSWRVSTASGTRIGRMPQPAALDADHRSRRALLFVWPSVPFPKHAHGCLLLRAVER